MEKVGGFLQKFLENKAGRNIYRKVCGIGIKPPNQNGIEKPRSCDLRGFHFVCCLTLISFLATASIAYATAKIKYSLF